MQQWPLIAFFEYLKRKTRNFLSNKTAYERETSPKWTFFTAVRLHIWRIYYSYTQNKKIIRQHKTSQHFSCLPFFSACFHPYLSHTFIHFFVCAKCEWNDHCIAEIKYQLFTFLPRISHKYNFVVCAKNRTANTHARFTGRIKRRNLNNNHNQCPFLESPQSSLIFFWIIE